MDHTKAIHTQSSSWKYLLGKEEQRKFHYSNLIYVNYLFIVYLFFGRDAIVAPSLQSMSAVHCSRFILLITVNDHKFTFRRKIILLFIYRWPRRVYPRRYLWDSSQIDDRKSVLISSHSNRHRRTVEVHRMATTVQEGLAHAGPDMYSTRLFGSPNRPADAQWQQHCGGY